MFKYYIRHSFRQYRKRGNCFETRTERQEFEISKKHAESIICDQDIWFMEQRAKSMDTCEFSDHGHDIWFLETRDGFEKGDELIVEYYPPQYNYFTKYRDVFATVTRDELIAEIGIEKAERMEFCEEEGGHLIYIVGDQEFSLELAE